jgi:hypothetical protein
MTPERPGGCGFLSDDDVPVRGPRGKKTGQAWDAKWNSREQNKDTAIVTTDRGGMIGI